MPVTRLGVCLLLAAAPAFAEKTPEDLARIRAQSRPSGVEWPRPKFSLLVRAGVVLGDLPVGSTAGLQLAVAPGLLDRALLFGLDVSAKRSALDGAYVSYHLRADELEAAAVVAYQPTSSTSWVLPFVGAGLGVTAMRAATTFPGAGTRNESELRPLGFVFGGLRFPLAPGAVEVEARARHSPSQTKALSGSSVERYSITAGYRIGF